MKSTSCWLELSFTRQTVQEDKALIYEDWKENILPLLDLAPLKLNTNFFGIKQYFAAKSLIASRSFEIDEYHGSGMVPFADLFNHKTGAEDVHFTSISSHDESDSDSDSNNNDVEANEEPSATKLILGKDFNGSELDSSSVSGDDMTVLEMIMVKDVCVGAEVFNTYGLLGNAALLHRYGFTEQDNLYDIVNIDLELVLQWSRSLYSGRYSRARVSMWRRLGYSACVSQNSEYFEISTDGEQQIELLILLYIMSLPEDAYHKLDLTISTAADSNEGGGMTLLKNNTLWEKTSKMSKEFLLNRNVCNALLALADLRESLYGSNSIEDDIEALEKFSCIEERKLYHSLVLRISERKILDKLRIYAAACIQTFRKDKQNSAMKKSKRTRKEL